MPAAANSALVTWKQASAREPSMTLVADTVPFVTALSTAPASCCPIAAVSV